MKNRKSLLLLTALVLAVPCMAAGLEIEGKVAGVEGSRVKIEYQSEFVPRKGDEVQFGFEIPGEGFIPFEGTWKVQDSDERFIWAEPKKAGLESPPPDYIAKIFSPNPKKKPGALSDAEGIYLQARKYEFGEGVKKDLVKAIELYRKAAEKGHVISQSNLGFMYANGRGVSQDYVEAIRWYRVAAEKGDAPAQSNLGFMYANGRGVSRDYSEAFKWYRKAAEQGQATGQSNLGNAYAHARGVKRDYVRAFKWYSLAAAQTKGEIHNRAANNIDIISKKMTPAQIGEAQRLVREWKPKR